MIALDTSVLIEALGAGARLRSELRETLASRLYREVPRPRGREIALAIAACALSWNATLWTLNRADFEDFPGVRLR